MFDAGSMLGMDVGAQGVMGGEERAGSCASSRSHPSTQVGNAGGGSGGGGSSMFSGLLDPFFAEHASDPLGGSVSAEAFKVRACVGHKHAWDKHAWDTSMRGTGHKHAWDTSMRGTGHKQRPSR